MYSLPCLIFLLISHLGYAQGRPSAKEGLESRSPLIFQAAEDNSTRQEEKIALEQPVQNQPSPSQLHPELSFSSAPSIISGVTEDILRRYSDPKRMQPRKLDFDWPAYGRNDIQAFQFQPGSEALYQGQEDNSVNHRYQQHHLSEGNGKGQTQNGMKATLAGDWNRLNQPKLAEDESEMLPEDASTLNFSHHQEQHDAEKQQPPSGDITERDNGRQERLSLNPSNVSRVTANTNVNVIHSSSSTSNDNSTHSIATFPSPRQNETATTGESNRVTPIPGISPAHEYGEGSLSSHSLVDLNQGQGHSNDIDYDKKEVGQDDQLNSSKTMDRPETFIGEIQTTTPVSFLQSLINKLVRSRLTPVSSHSSPSHVQQGESITENQIVFQSLLNSNFQGSRFSDNENIADSSIIHSSPYTPTKSIPADMTSQAVVWESPAQHKEAEETPLSLQSWEKEKQKISLTSSGLEVPTKNLVPSDFQALSATYDYEEYDSTDISEEEDNFEISRSGILGPGPAVAVIAAGIGIALYVYGRTWRYVIPNEFAITATPPPWTTTQLPPPSGRNFKGPRYHSYLPASVIPRPDLEFDDEILYRNPSTYIKHRKPTFPVETTYEASRVSFNSSLDSGDKALH